MSPCGSEIALSQPRSNGCSTGGVAPQRSQGRLDRVAKRYYSPDPPTPILEDLDRNKVPRDARTYVAYRHLEGLLVFVFMRAKSLLHASSVGKCRKSSFAQRNQMRRRHARRAIFSGGRILPAPLIGPRVLGFGGAAAAWDCPSVGDRECW